jgi:hypothetical protein
MTTSTAQQAARIHAACIATHQAEQLTKQRLLTLIERLPAESLFKDRIADDMPLTHVGKPHFYSIPASAEKGLSASHAEMVEECDEAHAEGYPADEVEAMRARIEADYAEAATLLKDIA